MTRQTGWRQIGSLCSALGSIAISRAVWAGCTGGLRHGGRAPSVIDGGGMRIVSSHLTTRGRLLPTCPSCKLPSRSRSKIAKGLCPRVWAPLMLSVPCWKVSEDPASVVRLNWRRALGCGMEEGPHWMRNTPDRAVSAVEACWVAARAGSWRRIASLLLNDVRFEIQVQLQPSRIFHR